VDSNKISKSNGNKRRTLLIIFSPVFFSSLLVTALTEYKNYVNENGGNIPVIIDMFIIMVGVLLVPPVFSFLKKRIPTWLMVLILVILFALWEIGFDVFAPMIFPIIVDVFILVYTNSRPRALNN
jgi:hypothetical protein